MIDVIQNHTLHHARLRKCTPEDRLSFTMTADYEELQALLVKHTHPELSGWAAASFQ